VSESGVEKGASADRQAAYRAALGRLSRDAQSQTGEAPVTSPANTRKARRSDTAVFQDLAAAGEFTPAELREEIDCMGLLRMSHAAPADFAALAEEVGADVRGMDGTEAVGEVVRAIMSGMKPRAKKGGTP
jgi:hypothetical protein